MPSTSLITVKYRFSSFLPIIFCRKRTVKVIQYRQVPASGRSLLRPRGNCLEVSRRRVQGPAGPDPRLGKNTFLKRNKVGPGLEQCWRGRRIVRHRILPRGAMLRMICHRPWASQGEDPASSRPLWRLWRIATLVGVFTLNSMPDMWSFYVIIRAGPWHAQNCFSFTITIALLLN